MISDITGQRFGYLVAIRNTGRRKYRKNGVSDGFLWEFQCDCGKLCEATATLVKSGLKKSCGCKHYEMVSEKLKSEDLTGQRFGRLTVIRWLPVSERGKGNSRPWLCKCDCGNFTQSTGNALKNGNKISCGCLHAEYSKSRKLTHVTHNSSHTKLYHVWMTMKDRCLNPNSKSYKRYGARGITICNEWLDFDAFKRWALENGYDENADYYKCTIERVNNNEGYFPENCIWDDMKVQRRNQECVKLYEYQGKRMIITDWAKELNVSVWRLHYALYHKKKTIEEFIKENQTV